jgi:hypothetical protein
VRTGRGLGSVGAGQLVKQPVRGGAEALLVLLAIETVRISSSRPGTAGESRASTGAFVCKDCDGFSRGRTHIPRAMVSVGWLVDGVEEDGRRA